MGDTPSLEDLIAKESKTRGRGRGRGGGSRGGVRGGRGGRNSRPQNNGYNSRPPPRNYNTRQNDRRMDGNWSHDRFAGGRGGTAGPAGPAGFGGQGSSATKIMISNLAPIVTDQDMRELFESVGQLKKAQVHYNSSGECLGTAEIIYYKKGDAAKAVQQYQNVKLDGRLIKMQLVGDEPRAGVATRISQDGNRQRQYNNNDSRRGGMQRGGRQQQAPARGGRGNGNGNSRGGRGGGARGGKPKKEEKTQEQLDAELDSYMDAGAEPEAVAAAE